MIEKGNKLVCADEKCGYVRNNKRIRKNPLNFLKMRDNIDV